MTESEFKDALRRVMAANGEPPPMSDAPVLDAAKRDSRRRRTLWAGAGSAASVMVLVVGAVVIGSSGGNSGLGVGAGPTGSSEVATTDPQATEGSATSAGAAPTGSEAGGEAPGSEDTETSWPDGQTDRTASSGPRYDKAVALLDEVIGAAPDGYTTPDLPAPPEWHGELKYHQAQYEDTVDDVQVWEYLAATPLVRDGRAGMLSIQVNTSGTAYRGDGCDIEAPWERPGTCTEEQIDGKRVGVFTGPAEEGLTQWAMYRHDDGTVVTATQVAAYAPTGKPALTELPLSAERLAELATEDRFHLD